MRTLDLLSGWLAMIVQIFILVLNHYCIFPDLEGAEIADWVLVHDCFVP